MDVVEQQPQSVEIFHNVLQNTLREQRTQISVFKHINNTRPKFCLWHDFS